jgi:Mn2+/Fe2+ NRAMP family transporter
MKKFRLKEIEREFGLPVRLLTFLIRRHIIEPIVEEEHLLITEAEIKKYLEMPEPIRKSHFVAYLKTLGPGIITGAADDDPSGIGTYSTAGASYGLGLTWLAVYLLPMMTAIQETVARIGIVTNEGLSKALSKHYGKKVLYPLIFILVISNTINIGADIGAMVASLQLLVPVNFVVGAVLLTAAMLFVEVKFSYHRYAKILKWLTISLLSYVVTAIIVRPNWIQVVGSLAIPKIVLNTGFIMTMVAVMGTTISPYLFFWQASEEVEDCEDKGLKLLHHRLATKREIKEMRKDTVTGMAFANIVFLAIIITTASVFFNNGITNINSAAEAASALKPLAGDFASVLFTLGIFGVGLLAVPVLAGSSAYAISELFKWHEGLSKSYTKARGFYGIIIFSMIIGLLINFVGVNPIKALYYAAVVNGISAPILMFFIFRLGQRKDVMGEFVNPAWVNIWGFIATALMGISAIVLMVFVVLGI